MAIENSGQISYTELVLNQKGVLRLADFKNPKDELPDELKGAVKFLVPYPQGHTPSVTLSVANMWFPKAGANNMKVWLSVAPTDIDNTGFKITVKEKNAIQAIDILWSACIALPRIEVPEIEIKTPANVYQPPHT